MKKFFVLLLGASLMFLTTGCFDMVEAFFVNADGSGKYSLTMDMSRLFTDPFMKSMMEQSLREEGAEVDMEKDTTVYFRDMPGAEDLTAAERKLIENAVMKVTMSEQRQQMMIVMDVPFANIQDMDKVNKVMEKLNADQQMSGGILGGGLISGKSALFSFKKGTLTRLPAPKSAAVDPAEEDPGMTMIKMMLGDAKYTTIYHLPGKVKKASMPGAKLDGNTVTVVHPLLDVMDEKVKTEGSIKFK